MQYFDVVERLPKKQVLLSNKIEFKDFNSFETQHLL
jgi:hypothetical protein